MVTSINDPGSLPPHEYEESDPTNNRIGTFWQLWFMPVLFTLISLFWYRAVFLGYR